MGDAPTEICTQSDTPLSKNADFNKISTYNVSTVRDSEESSIMANKKPTTGFSTNCRWSVYVTLKSPKGWLKKQFFVFF